LYRKGESPVSEKFSVLVANSNVIQDQKLLNEKFNGKSSQ